MKKICRYALAVLLACLCHLGIRAQNAVDVTVAINPPYSPYFSTYVDQPNMVLLTLRNLGTMTRNVKLRVKIAGDNGVSISTNTSFTPSSPITLTAGAIQNLSFNSFELTDYFNLNNLNLAGVSAAQLRQNQALPEGNYSICVQALDYTTSQPLSAGEPMGCVYFPLSYVDPPQVIQPLCGNTVMAQSPQFVLFNWAPPATARGNVQYEFTLKEVPNTLNPFDVLKNNAFPVLFNTTLTGANSLVYSNAYPQLEEGKKYAWRVRASAFDNTMQFKNQGFSESCWFTYAKPVVTSNTVTGSGSSPVVPKVNNPGIQNMIPQVSVKGKLQWAFRKTDEANTIAAQLAGTSYGSDLSNTTVADLGAGTEYTLGGINFPTAGNHGNKGGSSGVSGSTASVNWGGVSDGVFFQGESYAQNLADLAGLATPEKKNAFTEKRDKILKLVGDKMYPLEHTKVKVSLTPKDEIVQLGNGYKPDLGLGGYNPTYNAQTIGTVYTSANGEFEIFFSNNLIPSFYDVALEIDDPNFIFPEVKIPLNSLTDNSYSIGTLTGLAKTFRLQFDVTDMDNKPLKNCTIQVNHDPDDWSYAVHPNLRHEGMRHQQNIADDLGNVQVAQLKDLTVLPRVFPRHFTGGHFCVETQHEGYYSNKVGLNISGTNGQLFANYLDKTETPVFKYAVHLDARNPEVKGTVVMKETNAPVKGILVSISRGSKSYTATTNDKGEFDIMDIEVNSAPYKLEIKAGAGIDAYSEELSLNMKPQLVERTIYVTGKLIPVTGRIVDEDGIAQDDAVVAWKTGGTPNTSNALGKFVLYNIPGKHILVVKKPGFRDKEVELTVKEPSSQTTINLNDLTLSINNGTLSNNGQNLFNTWYGPGNGPAKAGNNSGSSSGGFQTNWNSFLSSWNNVSNAENYGNSSGTSGAMAAGSSIAYLNGVFDNPASNLPDAALGLSNAFDAGDIVIKRFYLALVVRNEAKSPLSGCRIEFNGDSVGQTGPGGTVVLKNVSPNTSNGLVVYGPDGSDFIPQANNVVLSASSDTTVLEIYLKKGIAVSGKVSSAGAAVKAATVYIDGMDYVKAKTDSAGQYKLGIPAGNFTLRAVKTGLVGDAKTQDFTAGTYTVDFNLKDAGFDASKLLGFPIQLTESTDLGGGEYSISGEFVNLPSNPAFTATGGMKIPFHAQKVKKTGSSIAPSAGEIITDISSLNFTLWSYLHLKLQESAGIKVKAVNGNTAKGKIEGTLKVDLGASFPSISGFSFPSGSLSLSNGTTTVLPVYTSDGSAPFNENNLKLSGASNAWTLYELGLNVDYGNTYISKDGISIGGEITTEGFKYLPTLKMKIDQLEITKTGSIGKLKVQFSPTPSVSLGSWTLAMDHIDINPTGLRLGGSVKGAVAGYNFSLPFAELNLNKTNLTGGIFSFPVGGINLLDFVKVNPGLSSGLTFSGVPSSTKFQLSGNVNFKFEKYFGTDVKIDNFKLMSDGNVAGSLTTSRSYNLFSIISLTVNNLGINTATKQVDLGGKIQFDALSIGAGVGTNLHYKKSSVTFDDFDVNISAGGIGAIQAKLSFANQGFRCDDAHLKIASSPIDFKAKFHYDNTGLGAYFNMGPAFVVPIGPLSLDKIGGGFDYNKVNSSFTVYGDCRIKFTPDPYGAIELDPTSFAIKVSGGGPELSASAKGKVVKIPVADASFVMSIPERRASLTATAGAGITFIPGLSASGNFGINAEIGFGSDPYLFFGQSMNIHVPFLCNSSGGMAVGVNYPVSASQAETYHIPAGKFTGVGSWATASIGSTKENAPGIDVGIGTAKYWCGYNSTVGMWANLQGNSAGFSFGGQWGAGAEACVSIFGCFGLSASASGTVSGALSSSGIESASGTLAAHAGANVGCCGGCGSTKICSECAWFVCVPCGARVCINPSVTVSYDKGSGFSVSY